MLTIQDAINVPRYFLTLTGQWPVSSPTLLHRVMGNITFVFALLFSLSMVAECARHLDDYQTLSEIVSILIPPTSLVFKLMVFRMRSRCLLELIEHLDVKEFRSHSKFVEKAAKFSRLLGSSYQLISFLVILLYSIMPLVSDDDLPIIFTYDVGGFRVGMYAFQVLGLFNAVASNTCIDSLAITMMGFGTAQIDILNSNILNMRYHSIEGNVESAGAKTEDFNACVKHHNSIIRFVESIDNVFSHTILIQYITSAAGICNVGFQLAHTPTDDIVQFLKMIVFFLAMVCQLILYCWYSNEIILKSTAIRDACYESQWYEADLKSRRALLNIMERSKRPMFLTSGKFYVVSLESFMSVIRTSYSYFALLQTLVEKEE